MSDSEFKAHMERKTTYNQQEPPLVFRLAWYIVSLHPGARLVTETEAESQTFVGEAKFVAKINNQEVAIDCKVDEGDSSIAITVHGNDESTLTEIADKTIENIQQVLDKYAKLDEDLQFRLSKALVAKCCVDRIVYHVLKNSPTSDIYFQVAHAREMMIKATTGQDEVNPMIISAGGWLQKIESLSQDEKMPANIAKEIALKSVEWKNQIYEFIGQYL